MALKCILIVSDESNSSHRNGDNSNKGSNNAGASGGCVVPIIQRSFIFRVIPLTLTALREALQEHDLRLQLMPFVMYANTEDNKEGTKTRLDSDSSVKSFFTHVKLENGEVVRIEAAITAVNEEANNSTTVSNEGNLSANEVEKRKEHHAQFAKRRHSSTNKADDKVMQNVPSNKSSDKRKVNENQNAERENVILHKFLGSTFADEELVKLVVYAPKQIYERSEAQNAVEKKNNINNNSNNNWKNKSNCNTSNSENANLAEESSVTEKMFVIPCAGVTEALYRAVGDTIPQTHLKSQITYINVIAIYTINKENEKNKVELKTKCRNDHELRSVLLESARAHCPFRVTYEIKCSKPTNVHLPASVNTNTTNEVKEVNNGNDGGSGSGGKATSRVEVQSDKVSNVPNLSNEAKAKQSSSVKTISAATTLKHSHSVQNQKTKIAENKSNELIDQQRQEEEITRATQVSKQTSEKNAQSDTLMEKLAHNELPKRENKQIVDDIHKNKENKLENVEKVTLKESVDNNDTPKVESKNTEHVLTSQELLRSSSVQIIVQIVHITLSGIEEKSNRKELVRDDEREDKKEENIESDAQRKNKETKQDEEDAVHEMTFNYNKHEVALLPRLHAKCKELSQPCNMEKNDSNNINYFTFDKLTLFVIAGGEEHALCKESDLREWLALAHEAHRFLRLKAKCHYTNVKSENVDEHTNDNSQNSGSARSGDIVNNSSLHSKDVEHKLHESTSLNTINNERTAPFSVAVSVETKPLTSNRSFNTVADDKSSCNSSKSCSKVQSNSNLHSSKCNKTKENAVQDESANEHTNINTNVNVSVKNNEKLISATNEHPVETSEIVQKEEMSQGHETTHKHDNNSSHNISELLVNKRIELEKKEDESKVHEASESSGTTAVAAAVAVATEQQHDVPSHPVKKNKKIQYKYTYLCHELRSSPLHAEHVQAKSKQK